MRNRWSALAVAVLTLILMPRVGQSQGSQPAGKKPVVSMGQNYPNPFNPESRIKFTVGDFPTCSDGSGKQYRVTLKVLNVLAQVVTYPQLEGGSGVAGGRRLDNALLPCGQYTAYWDGKYLGTSREVASGIYVWAIDVDGQRTAVRSTVAK
jgi:hypothetical protein